MKDNVTKDELKTIAEKYNLSLKRLQKRREKLDKAEFIKFLRKTNREYRRCKRSDRKYKRSEKKWLREQYWLKRGEKKWCKRHAACIEYCNLTESDLIELGKPFIYKVGFILTIPFIPLLMPILLIIDLIELKNSEKQKGGKYGKRQF